MNVNGKDYITVNDGSKYQKADLLTTAGAITAGVASIAATKQAGRYVIRSFILPAIKKENNINLKKEVIKGVINSGLKKKGLKIVDTARIKIRVMNKFKKCPKFIQNWILKKRKIKADMFNKGERACFSSKGNCICINLDKFSIAAFHEMGHALNQNMNKLPRLLQRLRRQKTLIPIITAIALLKRKKVEGEKPKGIFDKTTDFIKNNCGKLTILVYLPALAEEGIASFRGEKLAESVGVSFNNLKKIKRLNRKAYLTYLASAIIAATYNVIGSKVRDKIAAPKKVTE